MKNRELDKWLAENVMGWVGKHGRPNFFLALWHPTEFISDAFQVVEKMMEKFPDWFFTLDVFGKNYHGDRFVATFQESAKAYIAYSCASGKTAPLAICLAAKEAIEGIE